MVIKYILNLILINDNKYMSDKKSFECKHRFFITHIFIIKISKW